MKRLVVFPGDPIGEYLKKGQTYDYYEAYYNPGNAFEEVYVLSPWESSEKVHGRLHFIQANPIKFRSIIKKINPDAIRAYGGHHCADWAAISKVNNIPIIVSVHDTNPNILYTSVRSADHVICMSTAVKEVVMNQLGISEQKISVMPNRVDIETFKKSYDQAMFEQLNKQYGNGKHILHVGRKTEQKNIDTVIKSLKYLPQDYTVIFVGQGDTQEYEQIAQNEGVSERCFFVSGISRNELPMYYSWCDCMCTPSRWEGFGMVFMEAASCECAIVTSNIKPMNEYLVDKENAYLVSEYENPIEIANAIQKACDNSIENQKIKHNARKVGEIFEKSVVDRKEIEIYEKVIAKGVSGKRKFDLNAYINVYWRFRN